MSGLQNGRNPALADFNWRGFAVCLRAKHQEDGRGLRAIADEIGVTASDLSRAMGGQMVSIAKVISLSEWSGVEVMDFYLPPLIKPMKSDCCSGSNVKHESSASRAEGAPAGPRTGSDGRSPLRPAAGNLHDAARRGL